MSNSSNASKRVIWIDFLKGLGIILVVIGHSGIPQKIAWWIWSFHMPLFFVISGYLFKNTELGVLDLVLKKSKSLLIPYISFTLLYFIFMLVISTEFEMNSEVKNMTQAIHVCLYGWRGLALWFLPVLFLTEITFTLLLRLQRISHLMLYVVLISSMLVGLILSKYAVRLPYKLEVVPTSLAFYMIGFISKSYLSNITEKPKSSSILIIYAIFFLVINIVCCFANYERIDLCFNKLGYLPLTYISSLAGIAFLLVISLEITNKFNKSNWATRLICDMGSKSLIILGIHQLIKMALSLSFKSLQPHSFYIIPRQILFWIALILLVNLIDKHLYFLLGRAGTNLNKRA
ncbi:hypothetical protein DSL64_02750 [Dyadobacter luteus]|uniref:Acyltransferase 3 domain-containing protein n=1 Tax=Dyadobacter luteus TaxID=2259619 RepID=A0A3D8YID7_9BACT|nr:acyltransferase family protein [Dyadobacter luteus]REA64485.1 hypothetical protein DSL64_02750 [Dyadobacter luteus]